MKHTNTHTKIRALGNGASSLFRAAFALGLATLWFAAIPLAARAATMGYSLSISSDYSLLSNPNSPLVRAAVAQKSEAVVTSASDNPLFMITNNSTTADISDVKITLTDANVVFDALKLLQSPPNAHGGAPFTTSVWGGSSKTIDIVLPTVLAPKQTLTFAVDLGPLGGFPNATWVRGYENIFWLAAANPDTNANLTVTYVDPTAPGDPSTTVTNVLPALAAMNAVTVTSTCCNTPPTSVFTTQFSSGGSVPEPSGVVLVLLGSLPLAVSALRKKYKRAARSARN